MCCDHTRSRTDAYDALSIISRRFATEYPAQLKSVEYKDIITSRRVEPIRNIHYESKS